MNLLTFENGVTKYFVSFSTLSVSSISVFVFSLDDFTIGIGISKRHR